MDEGITGTSTLKRKQFMAMMEDASKGCFDLIITREVSRFARNTVDTLQETRKLRRMGVEVYFTEDNIWTMNDEDGELRLTIMATLAQNESKKTSFRVKAGHQYNRKVWHTTKDGQKQFCYQCYSQIRTGSVRTRKNKGLSIEGVCEAPLIQDWKLELMAKIVFDTLWKDKKTVIAIANQLLESSLKDQLEKNYAAEIARLENQLEKHRKKLDNLIDMRLSDEIAREDYQRKRGEIEDDIAKTQENIEKCKHLESDTTDSVADEICALKIAIENSISIMNRPCVSLDTRGGFLVDYDFNLYDIWGW